MASTAQHACQDLPPVTDAHRQMAYLIIRPVGTSYVAAMTWPTLDWLRRIIEAKATHIRTDEWKAAHQRTVVPVKRCRPGADGHPVKWATQMAMGPWAPKIQNELI